MQMRICTICNSRMATVYEDSAAPVLKPLMADVAVPLTTNQQRIAGRWVIKTTLLFSVARSIDIGADYQAARRHLLRLTEGNIPPDGASVRIGRYPAAQDDPEGQTADEASLLPGGPPKNVETFGLHSLGYLAFEVVVGDPREIYNFMGRTKDSDRLIRIWPPRLESIGFPPQQILTRTDLAAMRNAFNRGLTGWGFRAAWGPDLR
jgi:hypothetical protein